MKNNVTVFLIDNNEIDNFVHRKLLQKISDDINVLTFLSATNALEYLKANKILPQVILLNLHLPIYDGFQFLEYYEKLDIEKKNIDIFILSAIISPTDLQLIKQNTNCSGYIEKPLTTAKLSKLIEMKLSELEVLR
jgi:CheY-like chemotaxis protein